MSGSLFFQLDLPGMLVATLASVTCALIGSFLILRRLSLMGDAISHSVLPGIVVAFLLTGDLTTFGTIIGASIAGVITAIGVEFLTRVGRVEQNASMGIVFTVLFAGGIVMMERAAGRSVHLDADCLLYGQLEDVTWLSATGWGSLIDPGALAQMPREAPTLAVVLVVTALLIGLFFKELRITSFDPSLAATVGVRPSIMHYGLMVMTAVAVVASFEAVGSILVIALLICPAGAARMLTDRLGTQVVLSGVIGAASALGGYALAVYVPMALGWENSLGASGMIAVVSGALLGAAIVAAPRHGVMAKWAHRLLLGVRVAREDIAGMLYRLEEIAGDGTPASLSKEHVLAAIAPGVASRLAPRLALALSRRAGEVAIRAGQVELKEPGRALAKRVVRTHRLWESYLVAELGLRPDHVHRSATVLEHIRLDELEAEAPRRDPHDRPIPPGAGNGTRAT